ncbi:MAG: spore coat protein GerQ [Firmicutes bacterium]|nr:spore coat protein GerQ [Bacillota bacterium]
MNNNYFNKQQFPGTPIYSGNAPTPNQQTAQNYMGQNELPMEQSYIENILRLNKGKKVRVHMTFPDSTEWRDLEFNGIIEQSGRDHIILSEPSTGKWQLLLMIYVDYISFDEKINYSPEFYPNN